MEKSEKRLTDGFLAFGGCFTASNLLAQSPEAIAAAHQATAQIGGGGNATTQILIPIITGVLVPFLKELTLNITLNMIERRKERRRKKRENQELE